MKLTWKIVIRISLLLSLIMGIWAYIFYNAVMEEVTDEIDDSLSSFSDNLIKRKLSGESLPEAANGTNNTFFIHTVSEEYAKKNPVISYSNEMVYIMEQDDEEPSRVQKTIFRDSDGIYYELTVATPTVDNDDLLSAITIWLIILYGALTIMAILVCLWVLSRSMKPLYRILRWLDDNDIASGVKPLDNPTKISEFVRLNDAVVRSAKRSEQLYTQQKLFTGNASHELQTPLAICQNRLELLMDTDLDERQMEEIGKMLQTISYMVKLNKELLMLTKIDGGQFTERETINISEIVEKNLRDLKMVFEEMEISTDFKKNNDLYAEMNPTLASILTINLMKNAFIHNRKGGRISITIDQKTIRIANTGDEEPLQASQIFQRFYKNRKKEREGSTGLGLALVKAIADIYKFDVRYSFEEKMHVFSIYFSK